MSRLDQASRITRVALSSRVTRLLLAAFLVAHASNLTAAPVVLSFEAMVASVLETRSGADLPFAVEVGDTIQATYSLDPNTSNPVSAQSGVLQFRIGGTLLTLSGYEIRVRDNATTWSPLTGRVADPANTPIVDQGPGGMSDSLAMSCLPHGSIADLFCGSVPGSAELAFRPEISFSGPTSVLNSDALPINADVWNAFSFREMSLSFLNDITAGESYVGAYVSDVRLIPEPPAIFLQIAGVFAFLALRKVRF